MAGDERPAKRVKLGDRDAESEAFAQGEFASGFPAYGGFAEAAPQDWNTSMPDVFDPGWKWEAASSAPNVPGLLLPLIPTDGQWRSSQMPTMGPYPGTTRLSFFLSPICLCLNGSSEQVLLTLRNLASCFLQLFSQVVSAL
jgi:hypothetical protein